MEKKKKKVDYEALNSSFMRIPNMSIHVSRCLIDLGFSQVYQLSGRSPEVLFDEIKSQKPDTPNDFLPYVRMAVYFSENENPDIKRLHPVQWT